MSLCLLTSHISVPLMSTPAVPERLPQVEIVTQGQLPGQARAPSRRVHRVRVFIVVFLAGLVFGQAFNLLRAPVYRSSATVLTVAQPAVDETTLVGQLDVQHVAVQQQLLLGRPLLEKTLSRLEASGEAERFDLHEVPDFQHMLSVGQVPSTHLVKLSAEGAEPELLPTLVNGWIESYAEYREQAINKEVGDTLSALRGQFEELGARLEKKRLEIDDFRIRHEILSQGRSENQAHAKLKSLTEALNRAREREVESRAQLASIEEAVEKNESVVPKSEQQSLINRQVELQTLKDELNGFEERYTGAYKSVNKRYKELPRLIKDLESAIRNTIGKGQQMMVTQARHELRRSMAEIKELEQQLEEHKRKATEFTSRFAQQQAMASDLEGLEELHRELEQRMAQIETKSLEKYPQVRVVEWGYQPDSPLSPDYLFDGLLVLVGSLILGIFAVWLVDYLYRVPGEFQTVTVPLSGVRVYTEPEKVLPSASVQPLQMSGQRAPELDAPMPRELTEPEVEALWRATDRHGRRVLALLLSGLSEQEAAAACDQDFDPAAGVLRVNGLGERLVPIAPPFHPLFGAGNGPTEGDRDALDLEIRLLAHDAGLPLPDAVNAAALRHTYILYLVRQGARLRELERIIGPLPAQTLMSYAPYSPKGAGKPLVDLELTHPIAILGNRATTDPT